MNKAFHIYCYLAFLEHNISKYWHRLKTQTTEDCCAYLCIIMWERRGRDRMVVRFATTYAISGYHHKRYEFESRSGEVFLIQHYMWLRMSVTCGSTEVFSWYSSCTPVSLTNKTYLHDVAEILFKVALNTITILSFNFIYNYFSKAW